MDDKAVRDFAICVATARDPQLVVAHLSSMTFRDFQPETTCWYMNMRTPKGREIVLIAQDGLTFEEQQRYARIDPDIPLPVCEAFARALPFSSTMSEVARAFPLLEVREHLRDSGSNLAIPIPVDGDVVGAVLISSAHTFDWSAEVWENMRALQGLLSLYVRTHGEDFSASLPRRIQGAAELTLTARQKSILSLVSQGKSTAAIASRLGFSESTIKKDIRHAMVVLKAPNRRVACDRAHHLNFV